MRQRIAVVEDDETIAGAIADRLRADGFDVEVARSGPAAIELCAELRPDLLVLDLMLPGLDGLEVCRRVRAERDVPVLMLTARDAEQDVLVGLGAGADDYVTKPFSPRELVARVHAILRRTGAPLRIGAVELDSVGRRVRVDGEEVHLTATEFELLAALAARPGRALTRDQLLNDVWGFRAEGSTRTVDTHVAALRRKLGAQIVRTVHGHGYALGDVG